MTKKEFFKLTKPKVGLIIIILIISSFITIPDNSSFLGNTKIWEYYVIAWMVFPLLIIIPHILLSYLLGNIIWNIPEIFRYIKKDIKESNKSRE